MRVAFELFPGAVELEQDFALIRTPYVALYPGDGHKAFPGGDRADPMITGGRIEHGMTRGQLDRGFAERAVDAEFAAGVFVRRVEKDGDGDPAEIP